MFNQEIYNKAQPDRLGDYTQQLKMDAGRFTAGRYLQALAIAKGHPSSAIEFIENTKYLDRQILITALQKAAVSANSTDDLAYQPVADSFLAAMRSYSIPLQLQPYMRNVPMRTKLYLNNTGEIAAEVVQGTSIPVLKGDWSESQLDPRKFAGIWVATDELVRSTSPNAALAMSDDLSKAVADAENYAFCSPYASGSVFYNANNFTVTGNSIAYTDADLKSLLGYVPFVSRKGCTFIMCEETATHLSLVRGSGGVNAYPNISAKGGELLGLPVLICNAMSDEYSPSGRAIGLLNPNQVFWAEDGGVNLMTSTQAALQQDSAPSGASQQVSLFQTGATALKAIRTSSWYARANCSAYMVTTY